MSAAAPAEPRPELFEAQSGVLTLRFGEHWLEDPEDPMEAAGRFILPLELDGAAQVVLFGGGLGYRVLRLKQRQSPVVVFEPDPLVAGVAHELMPEAFEAVPCFSEVSALIDHLSHRPAGERHLLVVPPAYEQAYPQEVAAIKAAMRDAQGFAQMRANSKDGRSALVLGSNIENLERASAFSSLLDLGFPLQGQPAFVVAAGPSLDRNGHLLGEARKRGTVFSVNTAAPAVVGHAGNIDVLVSIEALDVTEKLKAVAGKVDLLALDRGADASSFDVCGHNIVTFAQAHPGLRSLWDAMGVASISYGASVATAAFALAHALGADPIVLVGQDLAFAGEQSYATGTGREGWKVRRVGDVVHVDYDDATLALFAEKGLAVPTKGQPCMDVPGWGGGEVVCTYDMALFRRWFEGAGRALAGKRRLINATEGGARIEGFEERTLEDVLALFPEKKTSLAEVHRVGDSVAEAQRLKKALRQSARGALGARRGRRKSKRKAALQDAHLKALGEALGWDQKRVAKWLLELL